MIATVDIPLFPLNSVLFPGGAMPLRVFEPRYMDMVKDCLKHDRPFGVCLIESGSEVGQPAVPCGIGTLARISDWSMDQPGVLNVAARGGERFRIVSRRAEPTGLLRAAVQVLPDPAIQAIPGDYARLVPLLRVIMADLGKSGPPQPHRFHDATWIGHRYCEVLPISNRARQKLLELDDSISRLEIIFRFLEQKKLIVG